MRPWIPTARAGAFLWIGLIPFVTVPVRAQSTEPPVAEAERLRNAGDLQAAVRLLEAQVAQQPEDRLAARMLAQTLYWVHDASRARAVYEAALVRHPDDIRTRLDFGRMLLETGDRARLQTLITPLLSVPEARADASVLLGTLAYWEGDLTTAQRLLRDAVSAGAGQPEVRRQLQDIRILSAPWLRVSPTFWHDDQPLDRAGVEVEAGWFLTPLVPMQVRLAPQHYTSNSTRQTVWTGEVKIAGYVPRARMDVEAAGGLIHRSQSEQSNDWAGHLAGGRRLPRGVAIRGRLDRGSYFHTIASIETPVTLLTAAAQLRWDDPRGWLGEAEHSRQRFFDSNVVQTTYAWLLAPIIHDDRIGLQAGYAFATSDSDEVRFVLEDRQQQLSQEAGFSTEGRYDPYHTPLNQVVHSLIAAFRASSEGATIRISGSRAMKAEEDFPVFAVSSGTLQTGFGRRSFSPWTVRGALDFRVHGGLTVSVSGEAGRAAFYRWATAGVHLTYRFLPGVSELTGHP